MRCYGGAAAHPAILPLPVARQKVGCVELNREVYRYDREAFRIDSLQGPKPTWPLLEVVPPSLLLRTALEDNCSEAEVGMMKGEHTPNRSAPGRCWRWRRPACRCCGIGMRMFRLTRGAPLAFYCWLA